MFSSYHAQIKQPGRAVGVATVSSECAMCLCISVFLHVRSWSAKSFKDSLCQDGREEQGRSEKSPGSRLGAAGSQVILTGPRNVVTHSVLSCAPVC